jgi:hypothetical protein
MVHPDSSSLFIMVPLPEMEISLFMGVPLYRWMVYNGFSPIDDMGVAPL